MVEAHLSGKRVNGYHGVSALIALEYNMDMVSQIGIDVMHCVDIGVVKRLFSILLNDKNRHKE